MAGDRIERDAEGNPTGVLMDNANDLVKKVMPAPTKDERRAAVNAVMARLNAFGVTGVGDAGLRTDIPLYREMADEGALTVRIYAMIGGVDEEFRAMAGHGPLLGYGNDFLTVRSVKLFADGSVGSRGAAMLEPYSDAPGQRGLHYLSDAEMQAKIETALKAGFQVNVHAIGDAANRQVLDAFEAAYKSVDGRALRNRIEHAQIVAPADFARFKQLDLIASMQPTAPTSDMNMAEDRVGKERLKGAYAWRTFLDQGTKIAAGSDFPVGDPQGSAGQARGRLACGAGRDAVGDFPRLYPRCGVCRAHGGIDRIAGEGQVGRLYSYRSGSVRYFATGPVESARAADLGFGQAGVLK